MAVVAAVAAVAGWRRSAGEARRWEERALAAEAIGREQQVDALEERKVRDLTLSTMHEGVLLIDSDARVAFANEAIGRHLPSSPATLDAILPFSLRTAIE